MSGLFAPYPIVLRPGDCRDVLRSLPDASIDSVVTDPPYALVSIVKRFGSASAAPAGESHAGGAYARASAGFMGKQWDTGETAFAVEFWAEVMRVLKPGGHVAAFSGTRTYHRLAVAIEDAGFEIRDQLGWLYGTGFPKSHDVSKGIDAKLGCEREKVKPRSVISHQRNIGNRRPYMDDPNHMTVSDEPASEQSRQWQGWGTALKPAWEPIVLARKPLIGTVAENVLAHGTGAINVDGCRVGTSGATKRSGQVAYGPSGRADQGGDQAWRTGHAIVPLDLGRFPANILHDGSDEVVALFPAQAGAAAPASGPTLRNGNTSVARGKFNGLPGGSEPAFHGDKGSASRFFYCAKATKEDRAGSKHPTVKPIALMRWLVRLITPPGGTVLDPFAGTGTTGVAAFREGMKALLVEREAEYQVDIQRRLDALQGATAVAMPAVSHSSRAEVDKVYSGGIFG